MAVISQGFGGSTIISRGYGTDGEDPGPGLAVFQNPRLDPFQRGIRFANLKNGRAENIKKFGEQVWHTNAVMPIHLGPADQFERSGVVWFRKRPVPSSVRQREYRGVDQFGNPIYPFTGK